MKRATVLFVWMMAFASCEPGTIEEETETGRVLAEAVPEREYLDLAVNGEQFLINDPGKLTGEVQTRRDTGVTSLLLGGSIGEVGKPELAFVLVLSSFDGPGTYMTGTGNTRSGTELFLKGQVLLCNRHSRDPGRVLITRADDRFIEGNFKIRGYNEELKNYVVQEGRFRVERREVTF